MPSRTHRTPSIVCPVGPSGIHSSCTRSERWSVPDETPTAVIDSPFKAVNAGSVSSNPHPCMFQACKAAFPFAPGLRPRIACNTLCQRVDRKPAAVSRSRSDNANVSVRSSFGLWPVCPDLFQVFAVLTGRTYPPEPFVIPPTVDPDRVRRMLAERVVRRRSVPPLRRVAFGIDASPARATIREEPIPV